MSGLSEAFFLGVVVAASAIVALFFLKFWRATRDPLFLAFAGAFTVECVLRLVRLYYLSSHQPTGDRAPLLYGIRLLASLLILLAILRKNYKKNG